MDKIKLNNNMPAVIKKNANTPRAALNFYIRISNPEKKAGIYVLLNRLFWQGTKTRSAKEIADILDENAIDCYSDMKQDYYRFKILCLNEDFELAISVMVDAFRNSTLEEFEKEVNKLKGEVQAELDSPKSKALDAYYRSFFEGHYYGNTYTKLLEEIDSITMEDVKEAYETLLDEQNRVVSVVSGIDKSEVEELLNKYFSEADAPKNTVNNIKEPQKLTKKLVKLEKEDASQAQIMMGWRAESFNSDDYPVISLMNTILGSSGLSSRLFLELRDKKGLAYVVRSIYDTYLKAASFSVYIATEPKNIKTSLRGFKEEIEKIKTIPVSEKELQDAKNNLVGKRQFVLETNAQQAAIIGLFEFEGLGYDYEERLLDRIKNVTSDDIIRVANKYFDENSLLTVLAPKKYLEGIDEAY